MKSKERPWALTKKGPIHEVKKNQSPKKNEKERNNNNNNNNNKRGPKLGQARGHVARISARPEDMQQEEHQGPRTLMCPFEALRRGPWLTYGKTKVYVQISSKNH